MEITLAAGTYNIPKHADRHAAGYFWYVDDAPWAPGTQLQVDWLLSSAPSNGAPVESGYTVDSRWITYTQRAARPCTHKAFRPMFRTRASLPMRDGRFLRSMPNIGTGSTVTLKSTRPLRTNLTLATLQIAVDGRAPLVMQTSRRGSMHLLLPR